MLNRNCGLTHGSGRALKLIHQRDPPRTRVWTAGKDEICSVCDGKHGGGKHLRIDCPDLKNSERPQKKTAKQGESKGSDKDHPAKGSGKIAVGSAHESLSNDPTIINDDSSNDGIIFEDLDFVLTDEAFAFLLDTSSGKAKC